MNSINNTPNVNFTAGMNIRGFKNNANRLSNITRMFEAKTAKYPNDTIEITNFPGEGIQIYHTDKGIEHEHCADITTDQWNKLFENTDEFITKKLVKLFNIFKKHDSEYNKAGKYIVLVIKKDKNNDPTNFEQKFWDIVVAKAHKDMEIAVNKDSVLREFNIY